MNVNNEWGIITFNLTRKYAVNKFNDYKEHFFQQCITKGFIRWQEVSPIQFFGLTIFTMSLCVIIYDKSKLAPTDQRGVAKLLAQSGYAHFVFANHFKWQPTMLVYNLFCDNRDCIFILDIRKQLNSPTKGSGAWNWQRIDERELNAVNRKYQGCLCEEKRNDSVKNVEIRK